ncbi:S-adenosyl-L-methionine-dependent methyltransferase [Meira miltonrushii]|uniref:Trimethylguanosine synthase n=1 Tax=Meira miltonrushii TaxID=1280837 RepID=A0A316V5K8_9BASI|nr:S-adenosyl-L-methionine-dependent methyltransferase [Meira miltonrushii]PWN32308.1 S-adenosyl-L-methionine-dependent methyltransferase [Meira miltonrushii]
MPRRKNRKTNVKRSYGQTFGTKEDEEERSGDIYDHALTEADQFPENMLKYWRQRRSLFTLFDGSSITGELPLLDRESWYSITPEPIAARIAQRCRCGIVLDAFCGVGGNAIQFALTCERVIAIDIDPIKLEMAKHNARVYGVEQYITFLQGDWREFSKAWIRDRDTNALAADKQSDDLNWQKCQQLNFDVVFLSPPWGGVSYRTLQSETPQKFVPLAPATPTIDVEQDENFYPLSALAPSGGKDLFETASKLTPNVCMFVPRTVDLQELASLVDKNGSQSKISVEEQWLRGRCKALSCYFGELAEWKEEEEVDQE